MNLSTTIGCSGSRRGLIYTASLSDGGDGSDGLNFQILHLLTL